MSEPHSLGAASPTLFSLMQRAQVARDRGQWQEALALYREVQQQGPAQFVIEHNIAVCAYALGHYPDAIAGAQRALQLQAHSWQTQIVLAKAYRATGANEEAEARYRTVLSEQPYNASALTGLADLALNVFGEPRAAHDIVAPLLTDPAEQMDAQLTQLMSRLYDREDDDSSAQLAHDARVFAKRYLQLPGASLKPHKPRSARIASARPRVGLLSNQFCVSPVYFLTIAGWRHVARGSDVILFDRGNTQDWASSQFRDLAQEVIPVQHMPARELARTIADANIDVLYDLGGWMDPIGLQALSLQPAPIQYKWVGGQSMSTGLDCFAGWIGDRYQSPKRLQALYSEPLILIAGGYATYTPPAYLPKPKANKSATPCIFSNPAKVSRAFLEYLKTQPGKKVFIHRHYRYERTQARIREALGNSLVEFVTPNSHAEALMALNDHAQMIDTFPYTSGLTAYEAQALGNQLVVAPMAHTGTLFAERHSARYWGTSQPGERKA